MGHYDEGLEEWYDELAENRRQRELESGKINIRGQSITISNGVVTVDGKVIDNVAGKTINITGGCQNLVTDCVDIVVHGDVGNITSTSGDVSVSGSVGGNIKTISGDVVAKGTLSGAVSTVSGDIGFGGAAGRGMYDL